MERGKGGKKCRRKEEKMKEQGKGEGFARSDKDLVQKSRKPEPKP